MPTVFYEAGYRFHFYSKEGNPREPIHVHVARPGGDAKLWLFPDVRVATDNRLNARELRIVQEIARRRREEIQDAWNIFFAGSDERQL
jgi:hypothetical protein